MPALRRLTVLLPACLALAAAGCGNADEGKISSAQNAKLTAFVDRAEAAFEKGDCASARKIAAEGADKVSGLKGNVDDGLRQNLIDGFGHLEQELASGCEKPKETATATPTVTEEPTEAPTASPSPTPEPTESPTPEPTVTEEPTPVPTPPDDTGGIDPNDTGELPSEDPSA